MVKPTDRWLQHTLCTCMVALVLACGQAAHAQSKTKLRVEAPSALLLGTDRDAVIRFYAPAPLTAALYTNIGSVGPAEAKGDGVWEARYFPPTTRFPQVALLALVSRDGTQLAWTRIALKGTATVELRSDPRVEVRVKVAGTEFGPVTTDGNGHAALSVVVPPGVDRAVSSAFDALGNERTHSIPLNTPPISPLLAVCAPENARDFLVFAARSDGSPAADLPLAPQATTVAVRGVAAPAPGVYRLRFDIPKDVRVGDVAKLTVASKQRPDAAVGCELPLPLDRPEHVLVRLSRTQHLASEVEPIRISIAPQYAGTREQAPVTLVFTASHGTLSQRKVTIREPIELAWSLGHDFGAQATAVLEVGGDLAPSDPSRFEVALTPAPVASLTARVDASRVRADGLSTTVVQVVARDQYGNAVRGLALKARAELGTLDDFEEPEPGQYLASYRAPLGHAGSEVIVVQDPATHHETRTHLELYSHGGDLSLAVRLGYLTNFARVSAPLGVVQLGYRLPFLHERLRLSAMAGYYQSSTQVATDRSSTTLDVGVWAVPVMLRAEYTFVFGGFEVAPLIGAGVLGAASQVESTSTARWRERHILPLLAAGANAGMPHGPALVCVEQPY
ncbi:MAG: hypothetical protein ABW321_23755, partial [Polyangiales bacterium]